MHPFEEDGVYCFANVGLSVGMLVGAFQKHVDCHEFNHPQFLVCAHSRRGSFRFALVCPTVCLSKNVQIDKGGKIGTSVSYGHISSLQ